MLQQPAQLAASLKPRFLCGVLFSAWVCGLEALGGATWERLHSLAAMPRARLIRCPAESELYISQPKCILLTAVWALTCGCFSSSPG